MQGCFKCAVTNASLNGSELEISCVSTNLESRFIVWQIIDLTINVAKFVTCDCIDFYVILKTNLKIRVESKF